MSKKIILAIGIMGVLIMILIVAGVVNAKNKNVIITEGESNVTEQSLLSKEKINQEEKETEESQNENIVKETEQANISNEANKQKNENKEDNANQTKNITSSSNMKTAKTKEKTKNSVETNSKTTETKSKETISEERNSDNQEEVTTKKENKSTETEPYYCVEGGNHHMLGTGQYEYGYYNTWNEAWSELEKAMKNVSAGSGNYEVDQCYCGLYYYYLKVN